MNLGELLSFADRRVNVTVDAIRAIAGAETPSFEFVKVMGEEMVASSKAKKKRKRQERFIEVLLYLLSAGTYLTE